MTNGKKSQSRLENKMNATDILVDTENPDALDKIVNQFSAAVVGGGMPGGYTKVDGHYIVRCFSNPDFLVFMMKSQGYADVVEVCSGLYK